MNGILKLGCWVEGSIIVLVMVPLVYPPLGVQQVVPLIQGFIPPIEGLGRSTGFGIIFPIVVVLFPPLRVGILSRIL